MGSSTYVTRIVALALFLAGMYGISELVHAAAGRGLIAWITLAGMIIALGLWMDDRQREDDGRPRMSWRTVREDLWTDRGAILTPVCFWGTILALILLLR
jgi:hypothetical protein